MNESHKSTIYVSNAVVIVAHDLFRFALHEVGTFEPFMQQPRHILSRFGREYATPFPLLIFRGCDVSLGTLLTTACRLRCRCHMPNPFKKRRTSLEDDPTDGPDQDGPMTSPSLHTDPTLPDDLDAENEDQASNYSKVTLWNERRGPERAATLATRPRNSGAAASRDTTLR